MRTRIAQKDIQTMQLVIVFPFVLVRHYQIEFVVMAVVFARHPMFVLVLLLDSEVNASNAKLATLDQLVLLFVLELKQLIRVVFVMDTANVWHRIHVLVMTPTRVRNVKSEHACPSIHKLDWNVCPHALVFLDPIQV